MSDRISVRQLCAAVFAAMCIPVFVLFARLPWQYVLLACGAAGILYYIMYRLLRRLNSEQGLPALLRQSFGAVAGGALCIVLALAALALAGFAAMKSADAFPETAQLESVGVLVLVLAAVAAQAGVAVVVRCSSVLFLATTVVYGIIVLFSAPAGQLQWLAPQTKASADCLALTALLLPSLALCFRGRLSGSGKTARWWLFAGLLTAVAAPVVTTLCLSPALAARSDSFYTLSGGVSVFGVLERAETFLSSSYLAGYFVVCALLLCAAQELVQAVLPLPKRLPVQIPCAAVACVFLLVTQGVGAWLFLAISGSFCGILTLATLAVASAKKL